MKTLLTRIIRNDKVQKRKGEQGMATTSPTGSTIQDSRARRARRSRGYRDEQRRLAQFEELARLVIKHRAALGISQQVLAQRIGTSHSAISRLESGRHKTSVATLQRVAEALGVRLVLGFESGSPEHPRREVVSA
jgi:ribosome-binding protein aMBF1 (putative translation factor)